MATGNRPEPLLMRSLRCDTDLSAKKYHLVNYDASDEQIVNIATDASKFVVPLETAEDGSTNEADATVVLLGGAWVKLVGTVAQGDPLTASTGGAAIKSTTDGDYIAGFALEAGVSGDEIPMFVNPQTISIPS